MKVLKRIVKHLQSSTIGIQAMKDDIDNCVGPTSQSGLAADIRRFYTDNYSALDRFDRLWYEMKFLAHPRDWKSYFSWNLIHCAVVNARAVWCAVQQRHVPLREFLELLITDESAM